MKVTIDIPMKTFRKAAYKLLANAESDKEEKDINEAILYCESNEKIDIPTMTVSQGEEKIHLGLAIYVIAKIALDKK